jgi:hypothetical protein
MHLPTFIKKSTEANPQIRLLLVGPPKWGKTYSAATFPNPIFLDFDNGLTNPGLRNKNIAHIPFYDAAFIKEHLKEPDMSRKANALTNFLRNEATKMTDEQTLVVDSLSTLCDALTEELDKRTPVGKNGEKDGFWFWKQWSEWLRGFCTLLTTLKCNVVVIAHEQELRDAETGRLLGYKWLLKGQDFSPRLSQFFTDVFRQVREAKENNGKIVENYLWQVKPSPTVSYTATRMDVDTMFIPANYNELAKRYNK